jgi:hypothetical protein
VPGQPNSKAAIKAERMPKVICMVTSSFMIGGYA